MEGVIRVTSHAIWVVQCSPHLWVMYQVLKPFIRKCAVDYSDNILINSKAAEECLQNFRDVVKTFYRRFIKNFNLVAPITRCLKRESSNVERNMRIVFNSSKGYLAHPQCMPCQILTTLWSRDQCLFVGHRSNFTTKRHAQWKQDA